jgi:adenine phosphoribosyltransferase
MTSAALENDLKAAIRTIPDYPKPGIMFRDITTLLGNARAFRRTVDELVQPWAGSKIDKVAGMEARGFILGGAVAHQVSAGFVPIRKKGKLPHKRVSIAYSLEYGLDEMEIHEDAIEKGERVILVDDLIATGGTAEGAVKLLRQMGAEVLAACFIIDLHELGGADRRPSARHSARRRLPAIRRTSVVTPVGGPHPAPARAARPGASHAGSTIIGAAPSRGIAGRPA